MPPSEAAGHAVLPDVHDSLAAPSPQWPTESVYEGLAPLAGSTASPAKGTPQATTLAELVDGEIRWAQQWWLGSRASADRADPAAIMGGLPWARAVALKTFLKSRRRLDWLRASPGGVERACLVATASNLTDKTVRRILFCPGSRYKCWTAKLCPKCALDQRIEPAQAAFGRSFGRAPHWWAFVIGARVNGEAAALRLWRKVISKPSAGCPPGNPLSSSEEDYLRFVDLVRVLFSLVAALVRRGIISGAFSHLEPHVSIRPAEGGQISHDVYLHLHILACSDQAVTAAVARRIYALFGKILRRAGIDAYPDVWIDRIRAQDGGRRSINGWLSYSLKPWPLGAWYRDALKHGCGPAELGAAFDEAVFLNLPVLFDATISTRRIGCMRSTSQAYVGQGAPHAHAEGAEALGPERGVPGGASRTGGVH